MRLETQCLNKIEALRLFKESILNTGPYERRVPPVWAITTLNKPPQGHCLCATLESNFQTRRPLSNCLAVPPGCASSSIRCRRNPKHFWSFPSTFAIHIFNLTARSTESTKANPGGEQEVAQARMMLKRRMAARKK